MSDLVASVEIRLIKSETGDLLWTISAEDSTGTGVAVQGGPYYVSSGAIQELRNGLKSLLQGHGIRQLVGAHEKRMPILDPRWELPS